MGTATNTNLGSARRNKNDEFYTQLSDIESELKHYRPHFKGKTVLCNCDDPYESNFFKFFVLNFRRLGINKLIASCYAGSPAQGQQISLFDLAGMSQEDAEAKRPYKVEITEIPDANGDGAIDLWDVEYLLTHDANVLTVLEGDGDFRSDECLAHVDEADIVVTNPPFSLFREFVTLLVERDKKFLVIGHQNAITYKEIFPLIKENKVWLGFGFKRNQAHFYSPYEASRWVEQEGDGVVRVSGVQWFTNMDLAKRHENLILVEKYDPAKYPRYDNYDAIEVSKTVNIPEDWTGAMGVPITFLNKHNPEQFEIIGSFNAGSHGEELGATKTEIEVKGDLMMWNGPVIDRKPLYKRIIICRIGAAS